MSYEEMQNAVSMLAEELLMFDKRSSIIANPRLTSYEEYLEIDGRVEVIDGFVYTMASPNDVHQDIIGAMYVQLFTQLKNKPYHPYMAPFDVRLSVPSRTKTNRSAAFTVVQPDLFVLGDRSKNKAKYIDGAPDFIMEVLSESSRSVDMITKFYKYGAAGVREYWMFDPVARVIKIASLNHGEYEIGFIKANGTITLKTLSSLWFDFDEVFA